MSKCTTTSNVDVVCTYHFLMINFDVLLNLDRSINCHSVGLVSIQSKF
jgi:hypothetical protein